MDRLRLVYLDGICNRVFAIVTVRRADVVAEFQSILLFFYQLKSMY